MGKGKKRRNPGVGVDFRKVKHKVGKKLPKAQNETKTDFQSRSINLPTQSVAQDKAGAAVSDRNLTLKELVNQLSHHNTHTRRDALSGLQQLITAHPSEATRHAALLLEALATRVADGEQPVRSALLSLLQTAALPAVGPAVLSPFLPVFMAHLSAALTHLSADVRLDALAVLEALTEAAPQLMSSDQQLQAALAHYTGLASRSNRGKSVKSQALSGLRKVLSSLERFLTAALNSAAAGGREGPVSKDGVGRAAAPPPPTAMADAPLFGFRAAAPHAARLQLPNAAELLRLYVSSNNCHAIDLQQRQQQSAAGAAAAPAAAPASSIGQPAVTCRQQILQVLSVLFDCWSEAAPASLSSSPEQESAAVLVHILASTQLLLSPFSPFNQSATAHGTTTISTAAAAVGASSSHTCPGFDTDRDRGVWLQQAAAVVLPKLLNVFPVPAPSAPVAPQLSELLQQFNLLSIQILTAFASAGTHWPPQVMSMTNSTSSAGSGRVIGGRSSGRISKADLAEQHGWQDRLLKFMADVLIVRHCLPNSDLDLCGSLTTSLATSSNKQTSGASDTVATAGSIQQLQGAKPSNSNSSSSSSVLMVLQCLQQLLPQLPYQQRQHLLAAVSQLAAPAAGCTPGATAAAGDPVMAACLQLQLQLLVVYLQEAVTDPNQESGIAAWLAAAPKLLWEFGGSKPRVSKLLLLLLYHAARLSLPGSLIQQQLVQAQQQLAPLFATVLPAAAGGKKLSRRDTTHPEAAAVPVVVGPLASLPFDVQSMAFDTLCFLPQLQQPVLRAVAICCRISSYSDSAVLRLLDAVLAAANRSIVPDQYVSLIATLLSASTTGGYADSSTGQALTTGFARHQLVTDAVCRWLQTYGPLSELLLLLQPMLMEQWQQQHHLTLSEGPVNGSAVDRLRCSSYGCVSLAALAAGCWTVASNRTTHPTGTSTVGTTGSSGITAEVPLLLSVPEAVRQQIPAVMASYCATTAAAASGSQPAATSTWELSSTDAAAATEGSRVLPSVAAAPAAMVSSNADVDMMLAASDKYLVLVLPLLVAAPDRLLLPFVQHLLEALLGSGGANVDDAGTSGSAQAGPGLQLDRSAAVAVAIHVVNAVLQQKSLRCFVLQHEQLMQQCVGRLMTVAADLQQQTGDAAVVDLVQKLQSAKNLIFGPP